MSKQNLKIFAILGVVIAAVFAATFFAPGDPAMVSDGVRTQEPAIHDALKQNLLNVMSEDLKEDEVLLEMIDPHLACQAEHLFRNQDLSDELLKAATDANFGGIEDYSPELSEEDHQIIATAYTDSLTECETLEDEFEL